MAFINASMQSGLTNPLDEAIVQQARRGSVEYRKVDEIPYDFIRKRLSVVVRRRDSSYLLITKGALENVLSVCAGPASGRRGRCGRGGTDQDPAAIRSLERAGYRVLGVAIREVIPQEHSYSPNEENDMAFAGFLLFMDPPKQGVQDTIAALKKLGIQLRIITGDNHLVATTHWPDPGAEDLKESQPGNGQTA